jgi:hypothetical protein
MGRQAIRFRSYQRPKQVSQAGIECVWCKQFTRTKLENRRIWAIRFFAGISKGLQSRHGAAPMSLKFKNVNEIPLRVFAFRDFYVNQDGIFAENQILP